MVELLTPRQYDEFFDVGFVVVPGLLARHEVARAMAAFDALVEMARGLDGTVMHRGAQFVVSGGTRIHRVVWCGAAAPVLSDLGRHPRLVALAGQVLGTPRVEQLINQAHFKLPGDGVAFPWHQDSTHRRYGTPLWTDVNGRGSFVEIAVALDPMGPENGGLRFVPGTGRLGHVPTDPRTGELPEGTFDPAAAVAPRLGPGDAVMFGPYTVHGSPPNTGPTPRRLFLNGFAYPGANRRIYPGDGAGRVLDVAQPIDRAA
jgi:ectoine hydroxylase-related dioxygenase (phytanoyl-CoA dioxygenase family)